MLGSERMLLAEEGSGLPKIKKNAPPESLSKTVVFERRRRFRLGRSEQIRAAFPEWLDRARVGPLADTHGFTPVAIPHDPKVRCA
jgi:hypothetical protein